MELNQIVWHDFGKLRIEEFRPKMSGDPATLCRVLVAWKPIPRKGERVFIPLSELIESNPEIVAKEKARQDREDDRQARRIIKENQQQEKERFIQMQDAEQRLVAGELAFIPHTIKVELRSSAIPEVEKIYLELTGLSLPEPSRSPGSFVKIEENRPYAPDEWRVYDYDMSLLSEPAQAIVSRYAEKRINKRLIVHELLKRGSHLGRNLHS